MFRKLTKNTAITINRLKRRWRVWRHESTLIKKLNSYLPKRIKDNPRQLIPPVIGFSLGLVAIVMYLNWEPFKLVDIYPNDNPALTAGTISVSGNQNQVGFTLELQDQTLAYDPNLKLTGKAYAAVENGSKISHKAGGTLITAELQDAQGYPAENVKLTLAGSGDTVSVSVEKADEYQFRPGVYRIYTTLEKNGKTRTITQNFAWGVLAINAIKSEYTPGQKAELHFGVLDENGNTLCNAELVLEVTTPTGEAKTVSTENKLIETSEQCRGNSQVSEPDYRAELQLPTAGEYRLKLTSTTKNGTYFIDDVLKVHESVAFEIERTQFPTRIYPPEPYDVAMIITANQDFKGVITETVPGSFAILEKNYETDFLTSAVRDELNKPALTNLPFPKLTESGTNKLLSWDVDVKAGEAVLLRYTIKFPDISPEFYLLGPLQLTKADSEEVLYQEARQWQIASDAVVVSGTMSSTEAQFGGQQRKIVYANSNWYAFYTDGGDVWYKKSADGTTWGSAVDLDSSDADNYNPTAAVATNGLYIQVFWVDDGAEVIEGRIIDTTSSDTLGTLCQTSAQGTLGSTVMPTIAPLTSVDLMMAYSDTSTDSEVDVFTITGLSGGCTVSDSNPGNVLFGTQGAGLTASDRPVLVSLGAERAMMVFQNGSALKSAVYDLADNEWRRNNQTIASVTDSTYSVTTDGTNVWVLSQSGTTATNLYHWPQAGTANTETLIDADVGASGDEQDSELAIDCPTTDNCKLLYADNLDTAGPDLVFVDCNNELCTSSTTTVIDTDTGSASNAPSPAMYCVASDDCKLVYGDVLGGTSPDVIFRDCDNEACSSSTTATLNADVGGNTSKPSPAIHCVSSTDCKVTYFEDDTDDLWFEDCDTSNCGTNTTTAISLNINTTTSYARSSVYCIATDDCKILYHDAAEGDLTLIDCSTATCGSLTEQDIDIDVGGTAANVPNAIQCFTASTQGDNCKLIYADGSQNEFNFVDCNNATCSSSTITKIDDTAGGITTHGVSLECISSTDCKGVYVGDPVAPEDQYFFDCNNEDCTDGSVVDLDNPPTRSTLDCHATDNCKLLYYDAVESGQPPLYFLDCATSNCIQSWESLTAPWTSEASVTSVSLTYDSTNSDLIANIVKDATDQQAYYRVSDATTISWGTTTAYDFTAGAMTNLSSPQTAAGTSQMGVLASVGSNLEFDLYAPVVLDPVLTQNHFRFRDDSTALNSNGGWLANPNTHFNSMIAGDTYRLRLEVANTGGTATNYDYRLEYATKNGTCAGSTFAAVPVAATSEPFEMVTSSQYANAAAISSSLLAASGTFVNGIAAADPSNSTGNHTLTDNQYTELEYAFLPTANVAVDEVYCFRLTNAGSTTNFTYSVYPEATIAAAANEFYWGMNEGTGTTLNNSLGNRYEGTFASGAVSGGPTSIDNASNFGELLHTGTQLVQTSAGTLYTVINKAGTIEVWKSDSGSSWAEQDTADSPVSVSGKEVASAIDSSDTIHILYLRNNNTADDLMYVTFSTATNQFGTPVELRAGQDLDSSTMGLLTIVIDSNDAPHILFREQTFGVLFYYRNKVGGSWNTAVSMGAGNIQFADAVINEDDIIEISYIDTVTSDLTAVIGNANNATSFTTQVIDSDVHFVNADGITGTSIGMDSVGNTWIAYIDENGTNDNATLVKHNDADAWSTWQTPVTNSNVGREPSIAISGTEIYFIYEDENDDIVYDMYDGSTWAGESTLQTGTFQDVKAAWSYWPKNTSSQYSNTGLNVVHNFSSLQMGVAQSFTGNGEKLTAASFYLSKTGSPTGNKSFEIFAHSGTYGTSSVPTGSALATSETFNISSLTGASTKVNLLFTGANQITLENGTYYTLVFYPNTFGGTDYPSIVVDTTSPTHDGNESAIHEDTMVWGASSSYDIPFAVYTEPLTPESDIDYLYSDGTDVYWASLGLAGGGTPPTWETADCVYSACLSFDGTSSSVTMANDIQAKSISFWVKPTSTTSTFLQVSDSAYISASSGTLSATGFTNPTFYVNGQKSKTITANQWNHIVVTTSSGITSSTFKLGTNGTDFFSGKMDELKVQNSVLTEEEVRGLYAAEGATDPVSARFGSPQSLQPGPIAEWKLDENSGSTVSDSSGNGNTMYHSAATWSPGKYGSAFDGNGARVVCSGSGSCADSDSLDMGTQNFSVSFWYKCDGSTNPAAQVFLLAKQTGTNPGYAFPMQVSGKIGFAIHDGGTYPDDIVGNTTAQADSCDDAWHHVVGVADRNNSNSITIYQDGRLIEQKTTLAATTTLDNTLPLVLGDRNTTSGEGNEFAGDIDNVRIYDYALSAADIVKDMNAGLTLNESLAGYWKFDEGFGSTANNASVTGSSVNGTLAASTAAPTWTNDGKYGKALNFDGSDDYVSLGDNAALEVKFPLTLAAWVNLDTLPSTDENYAIISKYNSFSEDREWVFVIDSASNKLQFFKSATGVSGNTESVTATTPFTSNDLGQWVHVMISIDENGSYTFYRNGKPDGSGSLSSATVHTDTAEAMIGAVAYSGSAPDLFFDGKLDEIKVFNAALTAEQASIEFNQGTAAALGSLTTASNGTVANNSSNREYCVPGDTSSCSPPILEWKLDETFGSIGSVAYDTSGNGYNVTSLGTGSVTSIPGVLGNAVQCSGTMRFTLAASPVGSRTSFSYSFWTKFTEDGNDHIFREVSADGTTRVHVKVGDSDGGDIVVSVTGASGTSNLFSATGLNDNKWRHVVISQNSATDRSLYIDGQLVDTDNVNPGTLNLATLNICGVNGQISPWFTGAIDNFRIYDYGRTAAQVSWEYNRGKPVAHYKFDECEGTTIYNSATTGNDEPLGNNGTLTLGAGGVTTAGTCSTSGAWSTGVSGKRNSSMSFDGTDDYVTIPYASQFAIRDDITLSAWIKRESLTQKGILIVKTDGSNYDFELGIDGDSDDDKLYFYSDAPNWFYQAANRTIADTNWHHVAFTRKGSLITFYIDGTEAGTGVAAGQFNSNAVPVLIGSDIVTASFSGKMDEVKVYNYALTSAQIKTEMNSGAVRFD